MLGSTVRKHKKLEVWQDAMELVVEVYRYTANLPPTEKFGLVSQMQRASISIPSNIAEGAARGSTKEYLRFLGMARGSLAELETQIKITQRLNFAVETPNLVTLCSKTFAKLSALIESLKRKLN